MKMKSFVWLTIVIGVVVLVLASNSLVIASRGSSTECGTSGCHDDFTVIELTSNATGTVEAIQGVNFTIKYTADQSSGMLKVVDDWADNDQFLLYNNEIGDNEEGDFDSAVGVITADITFMPLAPGTFTIRAWVAGEGDLAETIDITVEVTEDTDFTTPTDTTEEFDPIAMWEFLMMTINPIAGAILILLAITIIRRTKE